MAKSKKKNLIESSADAMLWTERLLELFWEVDEVVQADPNLVHPLILAAYQRAELARRDL